jgi:DnaJ-class molecular chaperone
MEPKDYYQILEIAPNSTAQQIKTAYRELAFQYHPDRTGNDPISAKRMKDINEAYAVLSNAAKRQNYDAYKQQYGNSAYNQFRNRYSEQDIYKGSDIHNIFEEMSRSFGFRGFDDIFKDFYGTNYKSFQFQKPGLNVKGFFFTGSWKGKTSAPNHTPLPGLIEKVSHFFVKKLTGKELPQRGADVHEIIELQPRQGMKGGPFAYYYRKKAKKLIVHIPPKVKDGQRIRLAGMGENGKGGGEAGDLLLKIQIKKPLMAKIKRNLLKFRK